MDYVMYRGDSLVLGLTVTQKNGTIIAPVDLTGSTIWMTAKRTASDPDNKAVFQITNPTDIQIDGDPTAGKATIIVPGAATVGLVFSNEANRIVLLYDIQVKTQTGIVATVATGRLSIDQDLTQTSA